MFTFSKSVNDIKAIDHFWTGVLHKVDDKAWIEYSYPFLFSFEKLVTPHFSVILGDFYLPRQRNLCINIHILIFLIQDIVTVFLGQRLFTKTVEIFIFSYLLFEILFHIFGGWLLFTKTAYVHKYSCSHIFLFEILVHILGWLLFICQDRVCA